MNTLRAAITIAAKKGYVVTEDGILLGPKGRVAVKAYGKQKYPTFSVSGVPGVKNKYGVFGVPVHKLAAFCFYGEDALTSECVRHLDGDVNNVSRDNIALGTHSENNMDKDPEVRRAAARKARAAQGKRSPNSKFSDEEVRFIRNSDESGPELSRRFNVTRQTIHNIRKKKGYYDDIS